MRSRLLGLLFALALVPTLAFADSHKADLFGGGSGGTGGSAIGGYIAGINWGTGLPCLDFVGPTASTQYGGHDGKSLTQTTYNAGVRWTLSSMERDVAADRADRTKKHYVDKPYKPFVQVLYGGVYSNVNDGSGAAVKDQSWDFGGGIDIFSRTAKGPDGRDHYAGLGFRVQYDYIVRVGDSTNFHRVSAGLVWRILKEHK